MADVTTNGPPTPSVPTRQSYWLGWLFVYWIGAQAVNGFRTLESPMDIAAVEKVVSLIAPLAAAARTPLAWYVVLIFTLLHGVGVMVNYVLMLPSLDTLRNALFGSGIAAGVLALNLLYFGYFYRRRSMFGAQRRWRTLERLIPPVVGPEAFIREQHVFAQFSRRGAFGFSFGTRVFLAVALLVALLLIYQVFFRPAVP